MRPIIVSTSVTLIHIYLVSRVNLSAMYYLRVGVITCHNFSPLQVAVFVGMLSFSIAVVNKVEIGLDQKLSMPDVSLYTFYIVNVCSWIWFHQMLKSRMAILKYL